MIPITAGNDGRVVEPYNIDRPFMRGIMNFDDYNYK